MRPLVPTQCGDDPCTPFTRASGRYPSLSQIFHRALLRQASAAKEALRNGSRQHLPNSTVARKRPPAPQCGRTARCDYSATDDYCGRFAIGTHPLCEARAHVLRSTWHVISSSRSGIDPPDAPKCHTEPDLGGQKIRNQPPSTA